jgi:hypothetical protein
MKCWMQNVGGTKKKSGSRAVARHSKFAWPLDRDRTPVPPKGTSYVRFATYARYINIEIPREFNLM